MPPTQDNLDKYMANVLAITRAEEESVYFREPVSAADVPDYYTVVTDPMDLQTMHARFSTPVQLGLRLEGMLC